MSKLFCKYRECKKDEIHTCPFYTTASIHHFEDDRDRGATLHINNVSILTCHYFNNKELYRVKNFDSKNFTQSIVEYYLGVETLIESGRLCFKVDPSAYIQGSSFEDVDFTKYTGKSPRLIFEDLENLNAIFDFAKITNLGPFCDRFLEGYYLWEGVHKFTVDGFKSYLLDLVKGEIKFVRNKGIEDCVYCPDVFPYYLTVPFSKYTQFIVNDGELKTYLYDVLNSKSVKMKWY